MQHVGWRAAHWSCPEDDGLKLMTEKRSAQGANQQQMTVAAAYAQAVEHFNSGRYKEADIICTAIVQALPTCVDAINMLGVIAQRLNRHDIAIAQFKKALAIDSGKTNLYLNLGASLNLSGHKSEAVALLKDALAIFPGHAELTDLLREVENCATYGSASTVTQDTAWEAMRRGDALCQAGRLDAAIPCYREALKSHPDNHGILSNLGVCLQTTGQMAEAIECYEKALAVKPDALDTLVNLGHAMTETGAYDQAQNCFQRVLEIKPDDIHGLLNLAHNLFKQGRLEDSADIYRKLLAVDPNNLEAYDNICVVLNKQGRLDELVEHCHAAIAIDPNHAEAYFLLGNALVDQGKLSDAAPMYEKALRLKPDHLQALHGLGFANLGLGRYEDGWSQYELRLEINADDHCSFSYPRWQGEPLDGKTVLVYAEQGIGDEFSFSLLYNELARRAAHCIALCSPKLERLFARSMPDIRFLGVSQKDYPSVISQLPHIDYQVAAGSLAGLIMPDLTGLRPNLVADNDRMEHWRKRFAEFGPQPKIGISWATSIKTDLRMLSHSTLLQWKPILTVPGVSFVNLFHGDAGEEIAEARQAFNADIIDLGGSEIDLLNDLDDLYAMMSVLDMIVTTPSTVAAISSNLGAKVVYFLPAKLLWRACGVGSIPWFMDAESLYHADAAGFAASAEKVAERIRALNNQ